MSLSIKLKNYILYVFAVPYNKIKMPKLKIMSIDDTIDFVSKQGNSIIRFGDGEFSIIENHKIDNYQDTNFELACKLKEALLCKFDHILVCLPETLVNMDMCSNNKKSKMNWYNNLFRNRKILNLFDCNYYYGNAFISRPYMIYPDKSKSGLWFDKIKAIFKEKDLLVVEGTNSRNGVGNDLFSAAKSIIRILCPPTNAFDKYKEILTATKHYMDGRLVLLAIGPTSKPLGLELANNGAWVFDIGHLDSEYEWFLNESKTKTAIQNKHTAEQPDIDIGECSDPDYLSSIVAVIE